jgi:hypothetical protein
LVLPISGKKKAARVATGRSISEIQALLQAHSHLAAAHGLGAEIIKVRVIRAANHGTMVKAAVGQLSSLSSNCEQRRERDRDFRDRYRESGSVSAGSGGDQSKTAARAWRVAGFNSLANSRYERPDPADPDRDTDTDPETPIPIPGCCRSS